jgi:hypothetical protein
MRHLFTCGLAGLLASLTLGSLAAEPAKQDTTAPKKMSSAELLRLQDGRSGKGNLIATTGIRGFSKPASPAAHALIMTIGDYQGNIPKLSGVQYDAATATEIAKRMGVPAGNIQILKDAALTLEGMRKAFDDLEAKLGGNDQIFIYYSGHGGRQLVTEADGERCAESLITVDGQAFTDAEIESRLKTLSTKAQKTIMFLDACHSGGVTTRAVGAAAPLFTAKSWTPPNMSCVKPTNVLTRNIILAKTPISGKDNFVYIAAAKDSEISLDQPGKGGVATQAWLACLAGTARDVDGSGGLSAEEVRLCAQERIDQTLKNVQGYLPHHVSMTGNQSMVLSYQVKELPEAPVLAPAAAPAPAPVAVPAPVKPVVKPSALAALNDIFNSRDDRRQISLVAQKDQLTIGKDVLDFTLSSREGGHVYLLMVGSDGQTFDLLFPNQLDTQNVLAPGASLRLPHSSWQLSAEGPPGKNTLLAVVADGPRDFAGAGLKASGPFSSAQAVAAKDIQLVTASSGAAQDAQCSDAQALRNLVIKKRCSPGYGAALLTIEEVR